MFVVTTRSRLRGARFFPSMLLGTIRIRRQLATNPDVVRWASVVAGPTEFWTITVWRSRNDMVEFMRSGAHDDIMWLFSKWLRSFWLMRWSPGELELGEWKGLRMTQAEPDYAALTAPVADERLAAVLEHLPRLKAATSSSGVACYDATTFARRRRAEVGDTSGAVIYLKVPPHRLDRGYAAMRRLRHQLRYVGSGEGFARCALGVGRLGEIYLLLVWKSRGGARDALSCEAMAGLARLAGQLGGVCWGNEWIPENEFGNWDGLRLRRARRRQVLRMPGAAIAAADSDDRGNATVSD